MKRAVLTAFTVSAASRGQYSGDGGYRVLAYLRNDTNVTGLVGSFGRRHAATRLSLRRRRIDESPRLAAPQRRVVAAGAQQLVVRALLDDVATVKDDEPVHAGNGREPVRDGDHGLARHQGVEACLDRAFDLAVERRGCLVQHQDRSVLENDARNGDALSLAAGKLHAALADLGAVAAPSAP